MLSGRPARRSSHFSHLLLFGVVILGALSLSSAWLFFGVCALIANLLLPLFLSLSESADKCADDDAGGNAFLVVPFSLDVSATRVGKESEREYSWHRH